MGIDRFSDYVRKRLRALGLTQGDLASRAGISRQAVVKILAGEVKDPQVGTVRSMALALNVSPIHLFRLLIDRNPVDLPIRSLARVPGDHSSFVADVTVPNGAIVAPGSRFLKVWEIQNTGRVPWLNRKLTCVTIPTDATSAYLMEPSVTSIPIPDTEPDEVVRLEVWMRAPELPCECASIWKMVDEDGNLCFPALAGLNCVIFVTAM